MYGVDVSTTVTSNKKIKSSLYSRYHTQKHVTSGRAHLRGLEPAQHSFKKKRCRGRKPLATLRVRFDRPRKGVNPDLPHQ